MKVALALVLVAVSCSLDLVSSRVVDGNPKESLKTLKQLLNIALKEILKALEQLGCALMENDPVEAQKKSIPNFQETEVPMEAEGKGLKSSAEGGPVETAGERGASREASRGPDTATDLDGGPEKTGRQMTPCLRSLHWTHDIKPDTTHTKLSEMTGELGVALKEKDWVKAQTNSMLIRKILLKLLKDVGCMVDHLE
ncbi:uncharacterized protein LOC144766566 isoform X2 [Lissotriton helveticus]